MHARLKDLNEFWRTRYFVIGEFLRFGIDSLTNSTGFAIFVLTFRSKERAFFFYRCRAARGRLDFCSRRIFVFWNRFFNKFYRFCDCRVDFPLRFPSIFYRRRAARGRLDFCSRWIFVFWHQVFNKLYRFTIVVLTFRSNSLAYFTGATL